MSLRWRMSAHIYNPWVLRNQYITDTTWQLAYPSMWHRLCLSPVLSWTKTPAHKTSLNAALACIRLSSELIQRFVNGLKIYVTYNMWESTTETAGVKAYIMRHVVAWMYLLWRSLTAAVPRYARLPATRENITVYRARKSLRKHDEDQFTPETICRSPCCHIWSMSFVSPCYYNFPMKQMVV